MIRFVLGAITGAFFAWLVIAITDDRLTIPSEIENNPELSESDVCTPELGLAATSTPADNDTTSELPERATSNNPVVDIPALSTNDTASPVSDYYQPVSISSLHRPLLGRTVTYNGKLTNIGKIHEDLENQIEDFAWAQYIETQIRQTMAVHPNISQFEILNLECRETLCELQAFGYGQNAGSAWSSILESMRAQPWSSEIKRISGTAIYRNERRVILTFLMRNTGT